MEAVEHPSIADLSSDTESGPTPTKEDDIQYAPITATQSATVTDLARDFRRLHSQTSRRSSNVTERNSYLARTDTLEGVLPGDPSLDPDNPNFDLHKYLRMTMKTLESEDIHLKRADVLMKNVNIYGSGAAIQTQGTVGSYATSPLRIKNPFAHKSSKHILRDSNAVLRNGELLVVLGRPGSGCSTFLKTICGELHGLVLDKSSEINYSGISQHQMMKEFKGEVVYNQEVDKHFPHLTVGETLEHAAALRVPTRRPAGMSKKDLINHIVQVTLAVYGLSHTYHTKVGNDFVRGVSGGERKRVSIAEMALANTPLAAWDNSTRGLDSASALKFTKSLRLSASIAGSAHAVAIYQASQSIYDLFDKATVLHEGRQIYFGPASRAKAYFEEMGWFCPQRQTTADFLTSVTSPAERQPREGFEDKVPRTAEEFEAYWHNSKDYSRMMESIRVCEQEVAENHDAALKEMRDRKHEQQSQHTRRGSPYVASPQRQVLLNAKRGWRRIWNDKSSTATQVSVNIIFGLIIGSVYYGTPDATAGFTSKGAVLFFAVLLNALTAISEISSLYAQRPIVEKHKSYALYHPWTEAMAGIVLDIPIKFAVAVAFNIVLYFLSGLRREAGAFFIYFLVNYLITFIMIAVFRTMAALTKTVSQAMALSGVLVLAIVNYTGYTLPVPYMHPWFGWIRYINPVYYAFECLIANEFHGRDFACSEVVPAYTPFRGDHFICSSNGAVAGQDFVNGERYIEASYEYTYAHLWRNVGLLFAFLFGFIFIYLVSVELNSSTSSTAESLVFRKGHVPSYLLATEKPNEEGDEKADAAAVEEKTEAEQAQNLDALPVQEDTFTWHNVVYDITMKNGEDRRLLDHVSGWVKPGTLTALMGSSGAGKTTLLDALAQRLTMGVITGDMFVNGKPLDAGFQRQTGYVQQQDLHLETATVRESLRFSAMLRQPKSVSRKEKEDYVETIIHLLGMEDFAEAIVGIPGEGLNVEQRKLLTIGVELVAKPKLLLFLDEPTSGLDSQSSWAICAFLRKLADHGQAVLCTIHQPSAILFEQFDRLLFLRKGGQTVYFGEVGKDSKLLLDYFESKGARKCAPDENPAEYMLEMVTDPNHDWHETWKSSDEYQEVEREVERINEKTKQSAGQQQDEDAAAHSEFAMPFSAQVYEVTYRIFQQYWRMPAYVVAKFALSAAAGLFIGFSFYNANSTQQGMQNVLYSLFMVASIFSTIVQQIQPQFITQRSLYEVRERPSKAYSWKAFMFANIFVEIPYQTICGILTFATFYYPVVGIASSERQGLVLVLCVALFIYASTFAHFTVVAMPDATTAGAIVTLLFAMSLVFCGVMQAPSALPGFWIFMYRVSPFTYWVGGMADAMLYGRQVQCGSTETRVFSPPAGQTCEAYLAPYLQTAAGYLQNPSSTTECRYCALSSADQFLAGVDIYWGDRWRDFGIFWVYIVFDILAALLLYWFFRARKLSGKKSKASGKPSWSKKLIGKVMGKQT